VRVPKAGELVAAQLRRMIVLGELTEDEQLPSESVLMEQFGVSRPTLREAFRILEAEGVITVRRGVRGGARVQVPTVDAAAQQAGLLLQYRGTLLSDVYDVRTILEPAAARLLAERRTDGDIERLETALEVQRESLRDERASGIADASFHQLIIELCGNEALQMMASMVGHIIREGDRAFVETHDWETERELAEIALKAHAKLVDLVKRRKGVEVEEHWKRHLGESAKIVLGDRAQTTVVELLS
jgi:DNA-binding FadR family transcriptional regulator